MQRVNADLVGKVVNIASRCAGFITRNSDGELARELADEALWRRLVDASESIAERYEAGQVSRAVREITALADLANQYIAEREPWKLVKQEGTEAEVQAVCSLGLNLFRILAIYLTPILPGLSKAVSAFLNVGPLRWSDIDQPLLGGRINPYQALLTRVEKKQVDRLVEASKESPADDKDSGEGDQAHITIDEFAKVQLKVARIAEAEAVPEADKLLRLQLDLGDGQRQVMAGIKSAYDPASLIDRLVVVVANLAPRKMRFGSSEGMILAAGPGGKDIFLLSPDAGATPGMDVK